MTDPASKQQALEVLSNIKKANEGRVDVDAYFPDTDVFAQFSVDEALSDQEKAFALWKHLLTAQRTSGQLFLVVGKLLKEFWAKELFFYLDYQSFHQFISSPELSLSKESAYMYIRVYEFYVEKLALDPEAVRNLPVSKLSRMLPVVKRIEESDGTAKAIEKMNELNTLGLSDLVQEVKKEGKDERELTKPYVTFNAETMLWQVRYYENKTEFVNAGLYEKEQA